MRARTRKPSKKLVELTGARKIALAFETATRLRRRSTRGEERDIDRAEDKRVEEEEEEEGRDAIRAEEEEEEEDDEV
jgi:hypothetical protein